MPAQVPVLLMNPSQRKAMSQTARQRAASLRNLKKARAAKRRKHGGGRKRRNPSTPRKSSSMARRSSGQTPAQYRASVKNLKKARAARRSNPMGIPLADLGIGFATGLGVAGGAYLLEASTLSNKMQDGILVGGGIVGGIALSFLSPAAGIAMLAAGTAIGGAGLIKELMAAGAASKASSTTTTTTAPTTGWVGAPRPHPSMGMVGSPAGTIPGRPVHPGLGAVGVDLRNGHFMRI